jgi:hypothetical protein
VVVGTSDGSSDLWLVVFVFVFGVVGVDGGGGNGDLVSFGTYLIVAFTFFGP